MKFCPDHALGNSQARAVGLAQGSTFNQARLREVDQVATREQSRLDPSDAMDGAVSEKFWRVVDSVVQGDSLLLVLGVWMRPISK